MKTHSIILLFALIAMLLISTQCTPAAPTNSPTLDGKTLVQERCTKCHTLERIQSAKKSADEWKATVDRMVGKGAQLSPDELKIVVDYLTVTYPK